MTKRQAPKKPPKVSDHALLRYFERKYKIDFETIRSEMLTPTVRAAILAGTTVVKIDGLQYIVRDNTIITALSSHMSSKRLSGNKAFIREGLRSYAWQGEERTCGIIGILPCF